MAETGTVLARVNQCMNNITHVCINNGDIETAKSQLIIVKRNIERLVHAVDRNRYAEINASITKLERAVQALEQQEIVSSSENTPFQLQKIKTGQKGRPKLCIDVSHLESLCKKGYSARRIGNLFNCSSSLVYRTMYKNGLHMRDRYTNETEEELKKKTEDIHKQFPNSGYVMMQAHLNSRGTRVQRKRVRETLAEIDPVGTSARWGKTIQRRIYSVPCPNSLWHIDAHMKLVRWGFITHGCIDGYSRIIPYLHCNTSHKAGLVVRLFTTAIREYGVPSRVRSDHGGENISVALLMNIIRGHHRGSHITGLSVHNERIERLWRDVHKDVTHKFYLEFYDMEDSGELDINNNLHRSVLHFVFLPVIQDRLNAFKLCWNNHKLRTENNRTPIEIWREGMVAKQNSGFNVTEELFANYGTIEDTIHSKMTELLGEEYDFSLPGSRERHFGLSNSQLEKVKEVFSAHVAKGEREIFGLCLEELNKT